jgi:hypothetical protein
MFNNSLVKLEIPFKKKNTNVIDNSIKISFDDGLSPLMN